MEVLAAIFFIVACVASYFTGQIVESRSNEALSSISAAALWSDAQRHYQKGDSEVAIYLYLKIEKEALQYEKSAPLLFLLYARLAKLHEQKGSLDASASFIQKAIEVSQKIDPSKPLTTKEQVYEHLKKFDETISAR